MKKTKKYLMLSLFVTTFFNAQILKVEYEKVKIGVGKDMERLPEQVRARMIEEAKKPEKTVLYYDKGNSFYTSVEPESRKELDKTVNEESETKTVTKTYNYVRIPVRYYHNNGEDGIYSYHKIGDEEFYSYSKPSWKNIEYQNETQEIDNFECKLAEVQLSNGDVAKVWYTEQIPVSSGPLSYHNFPGLVLKIEAPSFTIYATKVSNEGKPSDLQKIDPKLKVYSGEEWEKKRVEMRTPQTRTTRKTIQL
ncbi:MAG: GLPGLI family protein [Bergeyella sp.]